MEAHYYAPYSSGSEKGSDSELDSNSDSDSDSDKSSKKDGKNGFSDSAARRLDDPRYAIVRAAGPSLNTVNEQLAFSKENIGSAYSNELVNPAGFPKVAVNSPLYTNPKKTIVSNLFSFKSEDRDITVYPFSTSFKLKTPRVYKNVTQVQLVQVNIVNPLSSFPDVSSIADVVANRIANLYDLSASDCRQCPNLSGITGISLSELGRTNPVYPSATLVHGISVRPGTYDPVSFVSELDQQTNTTPPFTTVSYTEHRRLFQSTKQVGHLFNEPGRWFYNKLAKTFSVINNKADIINSYLPDLTLVDSNQPSEQETFVAYFYPVLREAFLNPFDFKFLDLNGVSEYEATRRVLQQYQGLNSAFYYQICQLNLPYLQSLRRSYTFEYNPINDYEWNYSPLTQKISVTHTHLHKSIQADITKRYAYDRQQEFLKAGVSSSQIQRQLQTEAIVTDLAHQLNLSLVQLGVPYGLYSTGTLYDLTSVIYTSTLGSLPPLYASNTDQVLLDKITGTLVPTDPLGIPVGSGLFGFNTISTIIGDTTALGFPNPYNAHLVNANTAAVVTRAGANAIPGYPGVPVTATHFPSLYSTFINYQSTNTGLSQTITTATNASLQSTSNYLQSRYGTVLPPSVLTGLTGNVPANVGTRGVTWYAGLHVMKPSTPFDRPGTPGIIPTSKPLYQIGPYQENVTSGSNNPCCALINLYLTNLYGCIPTKYYINSAFYKMGFGIANFISFYNYSGTSAAISNDNIYLQLNPELSMNRMSVARPENTNVTNESTGDYNAIMGKILTEGGAGGASAQTIVQIPAKYNPPLSRIDHFSFDLLLDDLTPLAQLFPFQIDGTDWNAIIQIDEKVATMEDGELTSVPTIQWPNIDRPF
jgi:hypothetical protein